MKLELEIEEHKISLSDEIPLVHVEGKSLMYRYNNTFWEIIKFKSEKKANQAFDAINALIQLRK